VLRRRAESCGRRSWIASLALELWTRPEDLDERRFALAQLRARVGEPVRAAREMTAIARRAKEKPALQMAAWREAARFYADAKEIGNASGAGRSWSMVFLAIGPKGREKLPRRPSGRGGSATLPGRLRLRQLPQAADPAAG